MSQLYFFSEMFMKKNRTMPLSKAPLHKPLTVVSIQDEAILSQMIRFGISPGSQIRCYQKIPFGPVMIRFYKQEIAIGRDLADQILISTNSHEC